MGLTICLQACASATQKETVYRAVVAFVYCIRALFAFGYALLLILASKEFFTINTDECSGKVVLAAQIALYSSYILACVGIILQVTFCRKTNELSDHRS